jgi:putative addiction module CopG family antidote
MATMNVSLPDPMKEWVESRMKDGKFSNTSDYVRHLIRRDRNPDGGGRSQRRAAALRLRRVDLLPGAYWPPQERSPSSQSSCAARRSAWVRVSVVRHIANSIGWMLPPA